MNPDVLEPQLDQATRLSSHLRTLGAYATALLSIEEEGKELVFLWDHEMIHEIMFPSSAASPYSGLLWLGLESLREGSSFARGAEWRVVIPEGARLELMQTLKRMNLRYDSLIRRLPPNGAELLEKISLAGGLQEFSNQPEYREVIKLASRLQNLDHAVARLLVFLERYARPMGIAPSDIPLAHVQHYLNRLQRDRKLADDKERNEADALNLASAEVVSQEFSESPVLVTATRTVLRHGSPWARDPMFFALAGHFRRKHPNSDSRRRVLAQMTSLIQDMAVRTEMFALGAANQKDARIKKQEVTGFLRAMENVKGDPIFIDISHLLAEANQAVSSAFAQATRMAQDLAAMRLNSGGSPQAMMGRLAASLGISSVDEDLKWAKIATLEETPATILSHGVDSVIDAASVEEGIALSWESLESFEDFLSAISRWCVEHCVTARALCFRLGSRAGVTIIPLESQSVLLSKLRGSTENEKVDLLWIDADAIKFWYDPGDIFIGGSGLTRRRTRLALHVYEAGLIEPAAMWICHTAVKFVPLVELTAYIKDLWHGVINVSSV